MKIPRTPEELREKLAGQLSFLKTSAALYDGGALIEAERLAHTVRLLVHDTRQSHSLLGQLQEKGREFLDTSFPRSPANVMPFAGLVVLGAGGRDGSRYLARGDDVPFKRWVDFETWWAQTVFIDDRKAALSRRDLVLIVRNQDGGSHVDPELDEVYARLIRDNSMGWNLVTADGQRPMPEPAKASVRQIAHEVLRSLDRAYRWTPNHEVEVVFGDAGITVGTALPSFAPVGRNDPCFCGSGKKFKKCHGDARAA